MAKIDQTLTSIDYIILGLLQESPLTGYGIRKIFETTALGNYSSSPGTIYPALKRLQKLNLIENVPAEAENGKSVFQVQKAGTTALIDWLESTVNQELIQRKMAELILRFAFMGGLVPLEKQIQFLNNLIQALQQYLQQLEQFYDTAKANMDQTAQLAFEHGLSSYQNDLKWAKKALKQLTINIH